MTLTPQTCSSCSGLYKRRHPLPNFLCHRLDVIWDIIPSVSHLSLHLIIHKVPSIPSPSIACPRHCHHVIIITSSHVDLPTPSLAPSDSLSTQKPERLFFRNTNCIRSSLCLRPFNVIPLHDMAPANVSSFWATPLYSLNSSPTDCVTSWTKHKTTALCWGDYRPVSQGYPQRRWMWHCSLDSFCAIRKWWPSREMQHLGWNRLAFSLHLPGQGILYRTQPAQPEWWPWLEDVSWFTSKLK